MDLRRTKHTTYFFVTAIVLGLFGSGCAVSLEPNKDKQFTQPVSILDAANTPSAKPLPANMERRTETYADGRSVNYILIRLTKDEWIWSLADNPSAPMTVSAWREALGANLVINGAYFNEQFKPTGFYQIANSVTSSVTWPVMAEQNGDLGYTGLVRIRDGKIDVAYLPTDNRSAPEVNESALLTFPTLVAGHRSIISDDSKKYARRTVLALDRNDVPYILITESGTPSLYEIAKWIDNQPEDFKIAVNLDGGPSTGISFDDGKTSYDIPSVQVPNVVYAKHLE